MTWTPGVSFIRLGIVLLTVTEAACGVGGRDEGGSTLSAADSIATASEMRASLSGESAPGAQAYSYRGLYAGIARSRLESHTLRLAASPPSACRPSGKQNEELTCAYDVTLGPDSAPVHVDAVFGADVPPGGRLAREITAVRQLPLDVDGVRLARQLADGFDRQTALLDRRDATYGHHQALVKMGTLNGVRLNYVELTIVPRGGREVLTVKMSRSGAAPSPKPPAATTNANAAGPAAKQPATAAPPARKKRP